ncbi:hypothetical protein A2866_06040 [Candidatus Roizmanbacteria bacterium RIFCSPHIGHO2_01_FULL_39_8]|uniref:ABC transporter permease n=1 Tax=Candidatus Roizmanbacteria bacterium RIFCSPHIGHO2_01_FULL_39_8 TaxID=1802033 RepID=A0A1F7GT40_9BACT|nr:MAG: hypothetical protein A2866_06040 [Candidatus Roizmanbacteria bacterium RIFCSPHIGHO2_01_FULL_39_8]
MTYFIFILKSAIFDFSRNKGRTFLTSLGILIGVLSVVLMVAFGLGLKKYIEQQFESLGTNLLFIIPGGKNSFTSGGFIGGIQFDEKDVKSLRRIKTISHLAPAYAKPGSEIEANGKTEVIEIIASTVDMIPVFNLELMQGRLIEKTDEQKGSKVVLLAPKIIEKLFGSIELGLNQKVKIDDQNFKVIGVLKSKGGGGIGGQDMDAHAYIPFKSSFSFNPDKKYFAIYLKVFAEEDIPRTKDEIAKVLSKRYDNEDDFTVFEQTEILNVIGSIFGIINAFLVGIAAISLLVGGIGIMNIMYVTVTERIKEIGIRRAIGARKFDILAHFLVESILLSLFGGSLGIIAGFIITVLVQQFFPAYIDLNSVILALGVSSAIGIIFGVFPAKKAADLSPIDAVRYE